MTVAAAASPHLMYTFHVAANCGGHRKDSRESARRYYVTCRSIMIPPVTIKTKRYIRAYTYVRKLVGARSRALNGAGNDNEAHRALTNVSRSAWLRSFFARRLLSRHQTFLPRRKAEGILLIYSIESFRLVSVFFSIVSSRQHPLRSIRNCCLYSRVQYLRRTRRRDAKRRGSR